MSDIITKEQARQILADAYLRYTNYEVSDTDGEENYAIMKIWLQSQLEQVCEELTGNAVPANGNFTREGAFKTLGALIATNGYIPFEIPTGETKMTTATKKKVTTKKKTASTTKKKTGVIAQIHAIADKLFTKHGKDLSRSQVIEACVAAGLSKGTASVQWQKWKTNKGI